MRTFTIVSVWKEIGKNGKTFFLRNGDHYSIRKFTIGAASVMIGASIFGAGMVQAAETEGPAETEGTITQGSSSE